MSKLYQAHIQVHGAPYDFAIGHMTLAEYQALPTSRQRTNLIPLSNYASARRQFITCDLDEMEFNEIRSGDRKIFLFSQPAATCSIYNMDQRVYSGLIAVKQSLLRFYEFNEDSHGYSGRVRTSSNQIMIRNTAIHYTAQQMTANLTSAGANVIRSQPFDSNWNGQGFPAPQTKEGTMAFMGRPDQGPMRRAGEIFGQGYNGHGLDGGSWDLKPRIYAIWGSSIRYGNETWWLRHDHLSNIHYGYIAAALGFTFQRTIQIAGIDPGVPGFRNREDAEDEWPTSIGYNLFSSFQDGITASQLWSELERYKGRTYSTRVTSPGTRSVLWNQLGLEGRF